MKKTLSSLVVAAFTIWLSPIEYELSVKNGNEIISIKKYILTIPIEIEQEPSPFIGMIDGLIAASKWKAASPIQIFKSSKNIPFRTISVTDPDGVTKHLLAGDSYFIPLSVGLIGYSSFKNELERLNWMKASLDRMIDVPSPTTSEKKVESASEVINTLLSKALKIEYKFDEVNNYKPLSIALKDSTGDCKVKVAYLKHLLAAVNIKSEYILTSLDNFKTKKKPSEAEFNKYNHVIIYLPDYGVYLDPTNNESRFNILPGVLQWRSGVNLSNGNMVEISNNKPDFIKNTVSLELNKNKEITVIQDMQATGYYGYALSENYIKINNHNNSVKDVKSYTNGTFKINRTYVITDFKEIFGKTIRDIAMMKRTKGDICNYNTSVLQEIKITPIVEKILSDNNIKFHKKRESYDVILKYYECPTDITPLDTIIKKKY